MVKNTIWICLILWANGLSAQEYAADYIIPAVNHQLDFYETSAGNLDTDLSEVRIGYLPVIRRDYQAELKSDGKVDYKVIHFGKGLFATEEYAEFLRFNGNSAEISGHSIYELESVGIFNDVRNERHTPVGGQTMYKVPNESYQSQNWQFTDPSSGKQIKASSYYKQARIGGYEKKVLVVEFSSDVRIWKEYYLKHFGLVAIQEGDKNLLVCDLSRFNLFTKAFLDAKTEAQARTFGWDLIDRLRKVTVNDSFFRLDSDQPKKLNASYDSICGLYQHLMMRNTNMHNAYRYLLCVVNYSVSSRIFLQADKSGKLKTEYERVIRPMHNYYLLRPYPEAISKTDLSSYASKIEENYYPNYWKMDYYFFKTVAANTDFDRTYRAFLMRPRVESILRSESNIDNSNKCILYAYVSDHYNYLNDEKNEYKFLVFSFEHYKYLSQADKDLNIEYMRNVMKDLSVLDPGSEDILIRGIKAALDLKDYSNALRIAENGHTRRVGNSIDFHLQYAEAAFRDDVNKNALRIPVKILMEADMKLYSASQLKQLQQYCHALAPEFNCGRIDAEINKAEKREKAEHEKETKTRQKSSGNRRINLAIMANPFAGANISGKGGFFKFLPLSAELRTGKIVHEFRVNTFFGADFKNRLVGGKLSDESGNVNEGWKNLKGSDRSYAMVFVKNDISTYRKTCNSIGGGFQLVYGTFTSDPETTVVSINGIRGTIKVDPRIKRYEGVLIFKYTVFDWKSHISATMFYGLGLGLREIAYGNPVFSDDVLKDKAQTQFDDRRYNSANWAGSYLVARLGFRFGLTIF